MKQVSSFLRFLVALTALCAAAALAQAPPTELEGSYSASDRVVELRWHAPESMQQPLLYRVYRNGGGDSAFSVIGTAHDRGFNDSSAAPDLHFGYYVTAMYAGSVESMPSHTIGVSTGSSHDSSDGGDHGNIAFNSTPAKMTAVNLPYSYQPIVVTQPSGLTVCFELHDAPHGMTMDPSTGAISWTPGSIGIFEVELRARICSSSSDRKAEQKFSIMVLGGPPGAISGHVTDPSSNPIGHVRIKIFDATHGIFVLKTRTDSTGSYDFPMVNAGTYFIRADADSGRFQGEWYNGVTRLSDATGVVVAEGANVSADFVLHAAADSAHTHVMLSGVVRDSSGAPLGGAHVTAFRSRHHSDGGDDVFNDDHHGGSGSDDGFNNDHHDGSGSDDGSSTATDSLGAYHLALSAGSYFVRAKAEGFFEQFWDGKSSVLEADLLTLTGDTTGIDFALLPGHHRISGTGVISGTIRAAADSTPLRSHVLGLQKNFMGQFTGFITSTHSDSGGAYSLDGLPTGFYIVLAKDDDEFIPTFYTPSGGTAFLDSAAVIFVDGSSVAGADIYLASDTADGLNRIEGEVESENGLPGKAAAHVTTAVSPLPGAIVVISTSGGAVAGSTISDNAGAYSIPGLAAGNYTLTFQKPGSATFRVGATLAYVNNVPTIAAVNAVLSSQPVTQTGLMSVHPDWNLVSVPVGAADLHTSAVFPAATSEAFGFTGGYQPSDTLAYGAGYWMKFAGSQVLSLPGAERLTQTIHLVQGWNLIGSLSYPVAVSALQSIPASIVATDYFSYGGGYASASVIEPGRGYWVKASGTGTLTMLASAGTVSSGTSPRPVASEEVSLTIRDDAGNAQTLSLASGTNSVTRELPPVPPAGAFDVRFASGNMTELLPTDLRLPHSYPLSLQLPSRSVTVDWSTPTDRRFRLVNERGTTIASSDKGSSTITLGATARLTLIAEASAVPKDFSLQQNYPNPFNPSTSIRFELPAASRTTIRIFNLIGQEVSVLLDNHELEAGAHSVVFDASRLASGVYLYRMDAAKSGDPTARFSEVRKMVLVK